MRYDASGFMSDWALDSVLVVDNTLQLRFFFDCKQKLTSKKKALELPCTSCDASPGLGSPQKSAPSSPEHSSGAPSFTLPVPGSPQPGQEDHGEHDSAREPASASQKKKGLFTRIKEAIFHEDRQLK
jgi:hypothetical protein